MDAWTATFVAFGLLSQGALLLYFAARRWHPVVERRRGWVIYALGVPAAGLALVGLGTGAPPEHVLAYALFAAWAAFGALADLRLRIEWRSPVQPAIFGSYVGLFVVAQFAFWIPLWWIGRAAWSLFAALYAAQTALNVLGTAPADGGSPGPRHGRPAPPARAPSGRGVGRLSTIGPAARRGRRAEAPVRVTSRRAAWRRRRTTDGASKRCCG